MSTNHLHTPERDRRLREKDKDGDAVLKTEAKGGKEKLEIQHKKREKKDRTAGDKLELEILPDTRNYDKVTFVSE